MASSPSASSWAARGRLSSTARPPLVHRIGHAELEGDGKIVAHLAADGAVHLEDEAAAALGVAAPVVVAVVGVGRAELADQVAVPGMDVDTVEAGLAQAPRALAERLDRFLDIGDAGRRRPPGRDEVLDGRGRQRSHRRVAALAAGVAELTENRAARVVDALGEALVGLDRCVVMDAGLAADVAPARVDVDVAGEDQAGAAAGDVEVEPGVVLGNDAVVARHRLRGRRTDEAVLDVQRADARGLEQLVDAHPSPPVSGAAAARRGFTIATRPAPGSGSRRCCWRRSLPAAWGSTRYRACRTARREWPRCRAPGPASTPPPPSGARRR